MKPFQSVVTRGIQRCNCSPSTLFSRRFANCGSWKKCFFRHQKGGGAQFFLIFDIFLLCTWLSCRTNCLALNEERANLRTSLACFSGKHKTIATISCSLNFLFSFKEDFSLLIKQALKLHYHALLLDVCPFSQHTNNSKIISSYNIVLWN